MFPDTTNRQMCHFIKAKICYIFKKFGGKSSNFLLTFTSSHVVPYKTKFWREKILANFTQFAKIFLSN